MTITRDSCIGRGYLAREGDTGSVVWASGRDSRTILKGALRVSIASSPGQMVFSSSIGDGAKVYAPGVSTVPAPIANPSAVRVRITGSPYTGVPGYLGAIIPSVDGTWLIPRISGIYFFLSTNLGVNVVGYESYPKLILTCNGGSVVNGLQFACDAAIGSAGWQYSDANTTTVSIGSYYGVITPATFITLAQPPFYSPPGYGTVEILEWLP